MMWSLVVLMFWVLGHAIQLAVFHPIGHEWSAIELTCFVLLLIVLWLGLLLRYARALQTAADDARAVQKLR